MHRVLGWPVLGKARGDGEAVPPVTRRIIVIDGTPEICALLEERLGEEGYEVVAYASGIPAVSATSVIRSGCGSLRMITLPVGTRDAGLPELGRR